MRTRRDRLIIVLALVACMAGGFAVLLNLRPYIDGFQTPADLVNRDLEIGESLSIGGMVKAGSLQAISAPLGSQFIVTDGTAELLVVREGGLPSLFAECELTEVQGPIIALAPLTMRATKVLAKHDQYYVPADAAAALADAQTDLEAEACSPS